MRWNPRRNEHSKKKPECGACAQSWNRKTGFFTPCNRDQAKLDSRRAEESMIAAAHRRAVNAAMVTADAIRVRCPVCGADVDEPCRQSASGVFHVLRTRDAAEVAVVDATERAEQATRDLRRRALERGIDAPDDVPDEARENPRMTRRNSDADLRALERRVTSGDLSAVQALARAYERAGRGVVRAKGTPHPCLDLQDGWGLLDIGDVQEAIRARTNNNDRLDIDVVWRECGQGNTNVAIRQLEDAGWDFSDPNAIDDVFVMSVPDDFHGEAYRIYVHYLHLRPQEPQSRARPDEEGEEDEEQSYAEEHAAEHRSGAWVDPRVCQGIGCPYGDTGPS